PVRHRLAGRADRCRSARRPVAGRAQAGPGDRRRARSRGVPDRLRLAGRARGAVPPRPGRRGDPRGQKAARRPPGRAGHAQPRPARRPGPPDRAPARRRRAGPAGRAARSLSDRVRPMRCGLALSCVAWWASVAAAQPAERAPSGKQAIAILSLEIAGGSSDRLRGQVAEAVERAVAAAGARYIPAEATASALDGAPELRGCLSASCLGRLSDLTGAGRFIRAHVSVSGDSYVLDLELLSPGAEGGLAGR